jgi:hypothetical protein
MRVLAVTTLAALMIGACANVALADGPIATAAPSDAHPPAAETPGPLNAAKPDGADEVGPIGPCGRPISVDANGKPDLRPSGEVSVGVGTRGYREVSGTVCKPTANGGFVAISAGQIQAPSGGWRR